MAETFKDFSKSILASAIAANATSITLNDGIDFPTTDFYIAIDSNNSKREIIHIASRTGNVLTADAWGLDGTIAQSHEIQATVIHGMLARHAQAFSDGLGRLTSVEATLPNKADLVGGTVPTSQMPAITILNRVPVANAAARLALTNPGNVQVGDVAVQADTGTTWLLIDTDPALAASWKAIDQSDIVQSVNNQTGTVVLGKGDVGLGNVDNTSDANKPISTATQTALDAKAPLASPALTGTPTAPTPAAGDITTKLATTAFVKEALDNATSDVPRFSPLWPVYDTTRPVAVETDITALESGHTLLAIPNAGGVTMLYARRLTTGGLRIAITGNASGAEVPILFDGFSNVYPEVSLRLLMHQVNSWGRYIYVKWIDASNWIRITIGYEINVQVCIAGVVTSLGTVGAIGAGTRYAFSTTGDRPIDIMARIGTNHTNFSTSGRHVLVKGHKGAEIKRFPITTEQWTPLAGEGKVGVGLPQSTTFFDIKVGGGLPS